MEVRGGVFPLLEFEKAGRQIEVQRVYGGGSWITGLPRPQRGRVGKKRGTLSPKVSRRAFRKIWKRMIVATHADESRVDWTVSVVGFEEAVEPRCVRWVPLWIVDRRAPCLAGCLLG